jgi:hypothetical protein
VSDPAAAPDLEAVCALLEDAGDRDFLMSFQTAWGLLLVGNSLSRALVVLHRALRLAREAGQTMVEGWTLITLCYGHLHGGAVDEAQRYADELARIARDRNDQEALAYALTVGARVKLGRRDLAEARSMFADAAALADARSAAWARAMALCGLASATQAAGDEVAARANLEEALLFCCGAGYAEIGSLCGALALLLFKAGERDRAFGVFDAVAPGTESDTSFTATMTDPSGALRKATREAREQLGAPQSRDPAHIDLDAVLQAAFGNGSQLRGVDR